MSDANIADWVGRTQTRADTITPFPANALAATLDRSDPDYRAGDALPPLWHWLYFLDIFKLEDAGYDGHAALGDFLPPVTLPRRMWAGSRFTFHAPLRIGRALTRVSTILSVTPKTGRSGDMVFVTVGHKVFDGESVLIEEEHDIVYRDRPDPSETPPPGRSAPKGSQFSRRINPTPVLLFRYSALTFNGHRIHYDLPFCTGSEGYEGLVVHGPLLATLMMDLLRRQCPDAEVTSFEFRALAPVFDTQPFSVHGAIEGAQASLWVARHDGTLAMSGTAVLHGPETPR